MLQETFTIIRRSSTRNSSGCEGEIPCEVIFVKYGGEILKHGLVPQATIDQFSLEDANAEGVVWMIIAQLLTRDT